MPTINEEIKTENLEWLIEKVTRVTLERSDERHSDRLDEKLKPINEKLGALSQTVAVIHNTVFNGGQNGLVNQVKEHGDYINQQRGRSKLSTAIITIVASLIVSLLVGFAVNWYDNHQEAQLRQQQQQVNK